jgi:hypothetical protein
MLFLALANEPTMSEFRMRMRMSRVMCNQSVMRLEPGPRLVQDQKGKVDSLIVRELTDNDTLVCVSAYLFNSQSASVHFCVTHSLRQCFSV